MAGVAVAIALASATAGCGSVGDQLNDFAYTPPGQFSVYTCDDLERAIGVWRAKQDQLEQLMANASRDAGGGLVSVIAYRSEYLQARGLLKELGRTSEEKQCAFSSKWSSGRSVF